MNSVVSKTATNNYRKALATNGTAASFTTYGTGAQVEPATAGAALIAVDGFFKVIKEPTLPEGESWIFLIPTTNANNATASFRVWGYNRTNIGGTVYYVPTLLAEIDYTSGNIATPGLTSQLTADTVTRASGPAAGMTTYSHTDDSNADVPGGVAIDLLGSQYILFDFAINGGTATSMNALWRYGS